MTFLGLDVGTRRIGVAVGSTDVRMATPLGVIARTTLDRDAAQIRAWVDQYAAGTIVVGLPHELDGSIGAQAETVLQYAEAIQLRLELPLEFFDERYSTAEALRRRREMGVSEKRGRATIDAAAAAIILQDFLEALPPEPTEPEPGSTGLEGDS